MTRLDFGKVITEIVGEYEVICANRASLGHEFYEITRF